MGGAMDSKSHGNEIMGFLSYQIANSVYVLKTRGDPLGSCLAVQYRPQKSRIVTPNDLEILAKCL